MTSVAYTFADNADLLPFCVILCVLEILCEYRQTELPLHSLALLS